MLPSLALQYLYAVVRARFETSTTAYALLVFNNLHYRKSLGSYFIRGNKHALRADANAEITALASAEIQFYVLHIILTFCILCIRNKLSREKLYSHMYNYSSINIIIFV